MWSQNYFLYVKCFGNDSSNMRKLINFERVFDNTWESPWNWILNRAIRRLRETNRLLVLERYYSFSNSTYLHVVCWLQCDMSLASRLLEKLSYCAFQVRSFCFVCWTETAYKIAFRKLRFVHVTLVTENEPWHDTCKDTIDPNRVIQSFYLVHL